MAASSATCEARKNSNLNNLEGGADVSSHKGPDGKPTPYSKAEQQAISIELGERRMRNALRLIQEAQNRISEACEELSAIVGGISLGRRGNKLYADTKKFWHIVNESSGALRGKGGPRVDDIHLIAALKRGDARERPEISDPSPDELAAAEAEGRRLAAELGS